MQICITSNRKPVISNKSTLSAPKFCLFGLLNCRLVRNKYLSIRDYVVDKDFDIFAITETCFNSGDYDNFVIGSLIPNGYRFLHSARDGRGGGVGLLFKSSFPVKQTSKVYLDTFISFEAIESEVKVFSQSVSILIAGLLIFRAVADPRNSGISAKSREIPKKTRNTAKSARNISKYMSAKHI